MKPGWLRDIVASSILALLAASVVAYGSSAKQQVEKAREQDVRSENISALARQLASPRARLSRPVADNSGKKGAAREPEVRKPYYTAALQSNVVDETQSFQGQEPSVEQMPAQDNASSEQRFGEGYSHADNSRRKSGGSSGDYGDSSINDNDIDTPPLFITTSSLGTGYVGVLFSKRVQAQGGRPPYTWQIAGGSIPEGLLFKTDSGVLEGVPQEESRGALRIRVLDLDEKNDTAELPIEIQGSGLRIDTTVLDEGAVGKDYHQELLASGGVRPYTWSLLSGELPAGVSFQSNGLLSGKPEVEFASQLVIQVQDSEGAAVERAFSFVSRSAELSIITEKLSEARVCTPYYQELYASGGAPGYVWSIAKGLLPENLSMSSDGIISGTPAEVGSGSIDIVVSDSTGVTDTKSFLISIETASPVILSENPLPAAELGEDYQFQFTAEGACEPYAWFLVSGVLPEGVFFAPDGMLRGTPQEEGTYDLLVRLTDAFGVSSEKEFRLSIAGSGLRISTTVLSLAQAESDYKFLLEVDGGAPPYQWSIVSGGLPSGLWLQSSSGSITGIPEESGEFPLAILVRDSGAREALAEYVLKVDSAALAIVTDENSIASAKVGESYKVVFSAIGGALPYSWSISQGALPAGIGQSGDSGEVLSGTPTEAGEFSFRVRLRDSEGDEEIGDYVIYVEPEALAISTPSSLPLATAGNTYEVTLYATGGAPPYEWQIVSGDLPKGLGLNSSNGVLSGVPEEAIDFLSVLIQVSDMAGENDAREFRFTVDYSGLESITDLYGQSSDKKAGLHWKNPRNPLYELTHIVRSESSFPESLYDGVQIYSGTGSNTVDSGLTNSQTYYYSAFASYGEKGYSEAFASARVSVTPRQVSISGKPDPFVDEVISFAPLDPARSYGSQNMPGVVLGSPQGTGEWTGSQDVVSLHSRVNDDSGQSSPYGGSIVLKFSDNIVVDGPGVDFTIFENAFRLSGTDLYWIEPAVVDVSVDGVEFHRFPFDFVPHYDDQGELNLNNPFSYAEGFAGVTPVFSDGSSPDPTRPSVSGGDSFDLSALSEKNLTWIQYVRITATGDNWLRDKNGDMVRHSNESPSWAASGTGNSGFDLDAVGAVNY